MITNLNWLQPIKIGHFNQFVFTVQTGRDLVTRREF